MTFDLFSAARRGSAVFSCWILAAVLLGAAVGCGSGVSNRGPETDASAGREPADSLVGIDGVEPAVDSTAAGAGEGAAGLDMDRQAVELAAVDGAKTERVRDGIRITLDSELLFGFDSAMLKPEAQDRIRQLAGVFLKYPGTKIIVSGHTDSKGDEDYNFTLSERRALSVRNYLIDTGIPPVRIETVGYGEFRPLVPNDTEEGRRINRRVEIEILPEDAPAVRTTD
ncbi:MAG: OmpA family protein [bacterium]